MNDKMINDLQLKDTAEGYYTIKDAHIAKTKKGDNYIRITIQDNSGSMQGNIFDSDAKGYDVDEWNAKGFVKAKFHVSMYNDKLQANFEEIEGVNKSDIPDLGLLIPAAPLPQEVMKRELTALIDSIQDPDYSYMVKQVLGLNYISERFDVIPGGKSMHHDYLFGLLYHTYRMAKSADALCTVYTDANRDLLLAGTILHDVGKVLEFEINSNGLVETYSSYGNLLGHLYMGANLIGTTKPDETCSSEYNEKRLLLQHMLLSHHGIPEYGAVKRPCFFEAYLLHAIDLIDSRADMFDSVEKNLKPGECSSKIFALETCVYKPNLKEEE